MLKFMSAVLNGYSIIYLSCFFLKVYLHEWGLCPLAQVVGCFCQSLPRLVLVDYLVDSLAISIKLATKLFQNMFVKIGHFLNKFWLFIQTEGMLLECDCLIQVQWFINVGLHHVSRIVVIHHPLDVILNTRLWSMMLRKCLPPLHEGRFL